MMSNKLNKDNVWYQLGKAIARVCNGENLAEFLQRNNLYTTINPTSTSAFKKGTFEKLIAILDENNFNTAELKEMYLNYTETINGLDRYMFYWGYDIETLTINKSITFAEATIKWNLADSTLRKLVTTDKLIEGVDYRKSSKTWLITEEAMRKIYGEPKIK